MTYQEWSENQPNAGDKRTAGYIGWYTPYSFLQLRLPAQAKFEVLWPDLLEIVKKAVAPLNPTTETITGQYGLPFVKPDVIRPDGTLGPDTRELVIFHFPNGARVPAGQLWKLAVEASSVEDVLAGKVVFDPDGDDADTAPDPRLVHVTAPTPEPAPEQTPAQEIAMLRAIIDQLIAEIAALKGLE